MKAIWKYVIEPSDEVFTLPFGTEIISVAGQNNKICFWAVVDTEETMAVSRRLVVVGTGHAFPSVKMKYLGQAMLGNGAYVFHVFEVED